MVRNIVTGKKMHRSDQVSKGLRVRWEALTATPAPVTHHCTYALTSNPVKAARGDTSNLISQERKPRLGKIKVIYRSSQSW